METCLSTSLQKFSAIGLLFLAERSSFALLDIQRHFRRADRMAEEYIKLGGHFKTVADSGNSWMNMETYYWVHFVGKGTKHPFFIFTTSVKKQGNTLQCSLRRPLFLSKRIYLSEWKWASRERFPLTNSKDAGFYRGGRYLRSNIKFFFSNHSRYGII